MAVYENVREHSCSREERLGRRPASIHKNVAFQGEGIDEISRELLRMAGESSVRIFS